MLLWPLAVYFGAVIVLVGAVLLVSHVLGERHQQPATGEPYESGIVSTGTARLKLSTRFYLIGLLFVLFDLEAVFIFAWAVAATDVGWHGYIGLLVFAVLLIVGLVYEWRQGALDWGRTLRAVQRAKAARESSLE